jgi:hypothetical protein
MEAYDYNNLEHSKGSYFNAAVDFCFNKCVNQVKSLGNSSYLDKISHIETECLTSCFNDKNDYIKANKNN